MNRRRFLASALTAATVGCAARFNRANAARSQPQGAGGQLTRDPPNILVIIVDQMRYPSEFPAGIQSAAGFLTAFMPNVYQRLWRRGVKFANHYTAATPCSPARAALMTGLYTHQNWLLRNISEAPYQTESTQPWLDPRFPTYGKLLRDLGYQTPYIGKWHLSIPPADPPRLDEYGFDGLTYYDPIGEFNLQGVGGDPAQGILGDEDITNQALTWLSSDAAEAGPWCLTVSLLNPHDIEYFWAGTEFKTYNDLFAQSGLTSYRSYRMRGGSWAANPLKDPPDFGYPLLPLNWESQARIARNKPRTQNAFRTERQLHVGGVTDKPTVTDFSVIPYDPIPGRGMAIAPFSYWQRNLDTYTLLMSIVDQRIGEILDGIPTSQRDNTIIVFTSDHGDYGGAHGFLSGKYATLYDEVFNVPLIVVDPTGTFVGDTDVVRTGLTSSVDILPMLVTLGSNGDPSWQTGDLAEIYGGRQDLAAMLRSAQERGRGHVLLTSDDIPAGITASSLHLVGLRTRRFKLGTYAQWPSGTVIYPPSLDIEFYDYSTAGGVAELDNTDDDPRAYSELNILMSQYIPDELAAPLPDAYSDAQRDARQSYLDAP